MLCFSCSGSNEDFAVPCYTILPLEPRFKCNHFSRSATECQIRKGRIVTRQQINVNTAFIDASQIYGSSCMVAKELRDFESKSGIRIPYFCVRCVLIKKESEFKGYGSIFGSLSNRIVTLEVSVTNIRRIARNFGHALDHNHMR